MSQCGACHGSGECQHEFHDLFDIVINSGAETALGGAECPACGKERYERGNCSVCGGSGEQDE